jgi:hypothetical protein
MFVGQVEPLYCTGFETDPGHDGWSHGLLAGSEELGADDWMWGDPIGFPGSGDPRAAFSGSGALGNDLGGGSWNGEYQIDKVNYADSPELKVEPGTDLRLQYRRWLNVEDGYFDEASIRIDDETLWRNSPGENSKSSVLHHRDAEWRFHDVPFNTGDRSELRLRFQLASDGSFQLGGWTLDELCVVRWRPTPRCGDATAEGEALCPDDDGGEPVASQPLQPSGGCGCHQPRRSLPNPWPLLLLLGLLGLRRRRR